MILILVIVVLLTPSQAYCHFFKKNSEGWFWYEDPKKVEEKVTQKKEARPAQDPIAVFEERQKALDTALKRAMVTEREEDIRNYLKIQQAMIASADRFSDKWHRIMLTDPKLGSMGMPTSQMGRQIYIEKKIDRREAKMRQLARTHGLVFFFRGDCPYCHKFAPVLRNFAEEFKITVMAISGDGGKLAEFPQATFDPHASKSFGVEVFPSLYLVDVVNKKITPVAQGFVSQQEILENIDVLFSEETSK
ncbi:MAG: conjugal transfer protein TraF [Holosporales bacterium]